METSTEGRKGEEKTERKEESRIERLRFQDSFLDVSASQNVNDSL